MVLNFEGFININVFFDVSSMFLVYHLLVVTTENKVRYLNCSYSILKIDQLLSFQCSTKKSITKLVLFSKNILKHAVLMLIQIYLLYQKDWLEITRGDLGESSRECILFGMYIFIKAWQKKIVFSL